MSRNENRLGVVPTDDVPAPNPASTQTLNFITPTEFVEIPSGGSFYPADHPLHNQEVIEIKHMTTREEDILTSRALLRKGLALERMLQSVIVNKQVHPDDLLLGDKNALIVAARVHGYGSHYETSVNCPACAATQQYNFDLTSLEASMPSSAFLEEKNITLTENNTFLIPLPTTDFVVEVRLLTGHDEKNINKISEHKKQRNLPETPMTDFLRAFIVSVNGITEASQINGFIISLPAIQARFIRKTYDKLVPSLDLKHDFKCIECGHNDLVEVPLSADFFWSNS
jgi:hypothetical protein